MVELRKGGASIAIHGHYFSLGRVTQRGDASIQFYTVQKEVCYIVGV